ncbi:hypothetical protein [Acidovorax sp. CF316]|uniref:hypothetical protein n=1 Tax=Acidovorax sp. CF316 TaxID=1144317 RepID=UPI001304FE4A|nr:hypothetical protein [Acidovorax sp. CF316]
MTPTDPIEDIAYTVIIVSCQTPGCLNLFEPSLAEPFTDPIDQWAAEIAVRARKAGWTVGSDGCVHCPTHSELKPEVHGQH